MESDEHGKVEALLARRGLSLEGSHAAKRQRLSEDLLRNALDDGASESTSEADDAPHVNKTPVRDMGFRPSLILEDVRRLCGKSVSTWTATEVRPIIDAQKGCAYMDGTGDEQAAALYYASEFNTKFEDYLDLHPEVVKELDPTYVVPIFPADAQAMPADYTAAVGAYPAPRAGSAAPPLPPTVHGNPNVRVLGNAEDGAFFAGWVAGQGGAPRHLMITTRAAGNCVML